MTENKLISASSVPAEVVFELIILAGVEFELINYKPKILYAVIKIRDSKKCPDLDFIFHDISKNKASNIDGDTFQILISKFE